MKREMITVKTADMTLKVPAHVVASTVIAAALAQLGVARTLPAPTASDLAIPALGEYWPGQGGHNSGLVPERGGVPAHYLDEGKRADTWLAQDKLRALLAGGEA